MVCSFFNCVWRHLKLISDALVQEFVFMVNCLQDFFPKNRTSRVAMPHGLICGAAHFPFVSMGWASPTVAVHSLNLNLFGKVIKDTSLQTQKRLRKGRFFSLSKDTFGFESKHATVNKTVGKIKFTHESNSARPKSREDLFTCSTDQTLQTQKNVTLNVKTCESLNFLFLYCNWRKIGR